MKKVELSRLEYDYLKSFLDHKLAKKFESEIRKQLDGRELNEGLNAFDFAEELADDIREACSDQLMLEGFDEDWNPTQKGNMLEGFIDKFFVG